MKRSHEVTPFFLDSYAEDRLISVASQYPQWSIDGVCYDAGVGMTMSCRPPSPHCLMVYLHAPQENQKQDYFQFNSYLTETNELREFPKNLRIWVLKEVINDLEKDDDYDHFEFNFLNIHHQPPLFFAEMKYPRN